MEMTMRPSTFTSGPWRVFRRTSGRVEPGILYEDRNQYERALGCYQRILDVFPNHPRARLYLKDVNASRDMFYDEDERRKRDRLSQVLRRASDDFELSVRSRNCLQKMGVMTLAIWRAPPKPIC